MDNRYFFPEGSGFFSQLKLIRKTEPSVACSKLPRTNSDNDVSVDSHSTENYILENPLDSSLEYLNLSVNEIPKKKDLFMNLFFNDNSCYHQRKTVTIVDPNSNKQYPAKSIKKEKANDGSKLIVQCHVSMKNFLDLSSNGITQLSKTISKLSHITHLYIYDNKISRLPKEIGSLVSLKELWIQENILDTLIPELKQCKQLKHLDVRHNHLADNCLLVLKDLTALEILLLNHNKLTRLDGLSYLKKLETLSVKSNKLEGSISRNLGKLHNLVSLDLSKNRIGYIPTEIANCSNLKRLNLEYNNLTEIPESIGKLLKLEFLGIKYNKIKRLPSSLSYCILLKELNIENNDISELPQGLIQSLCQATKVNISHNNFQKLPNDSVESFAKTQKINAEYNFITYLFGELQNGIELRTLNLSCNSLSELKSIDIANLENLVDFNISFNQLEELPKEIGKLSHLESLELTNNNLTTLPKEIGYLKRLKYLNLESNNLINLPNEFGDLEKLKNLNISSNQLLSFPSCILNLRNLEMLNISENIICEIPDKISHLNKLTHLFLKDNKLLNNLPVSLVAMKRLTFLSISGCPLKEIPAEYSKTPLTVMTYLRAMELGMRIKEFLISSRDDFDVKSLFSSDRSSSIRSAEKSNGDHRNKSISCSESKEMRPRSISATSSSKNDLLSKFRNKKPVSSTMTIPQDLVPKMKTTDAGFLACTSNPNSK